MRPAERSRQQAQSIILLWLGGGPSQLETFDPHPDTRIAQLRDFLTAHLANVSISEEEDFAGLIGTEE